MTGLPNRQEGSISALAVFFMRLAPSAYRANTNLGEAARRIIEKQGAETTLAFFIESI
jgi:hypothetical protein